MSTHNTSKSRLGEVIFSMKEAPSLLPTASQSRPECSPSTLYRELREISDCLPIEIGSGADAYTLSALQLDCNKCKTPLPASNIRGNIGRLPGGRVVVRGAYQCPICSECHLLDLHLNADLSVTSLDGDAYPNARRSALAWILQKASNLFR